MVYTKSNDKDEERKVYLKDTLLMFQLIDINTLKKLNESFGYFEAEYTAIYDNGKIENLKLSIEKCKTRDEINKDFYKYLKEKFGDGMFEKIKDDKNIEDFYCIQSEKSNISLFYQPNKGYSYINLDVLFKNQSIYNKNDISLMIIYENNFLNHDNKNYPISRGIDFQMLDGFNSNELNSMNFIFQYIKYATDDGFLLHSYKYLNSLSFLDLTYLKNTEEEINDANLYPIKYNSTKIGNIMFSIYKSNYDCYRRTYKKIQSLLAEIMSVISLLFNIGTIISSLINEKKMSIDIISKLFNIENNNRLKKKYNNYESNRIKLAPEKINNSFKVTEKNNIFMKTSDNLEEEPEGQKEKILKQLNIFNIIKSLFCKGYKEKLISLCHNIIIKDMCIEIIIERFYNLFNIYNSINDSEKYNLGLNKLQKFREINSIIFNINAQKTLNNI